LNKEFLINTFYKNLNNLMMKRTATAIWNGTGKEGNGHVSTQSGVLEKAQYSYLTRFENGKGTNPEELIAAAHAGCFAMKLSFNLSNAGFVPKSITTDCEITFEDGKIKQSKLILKAQVENISNESFDDLVNDAKENCPISQLLNTEIVVESSLNK
jgi:lipoyl-dependent peroxiredoxin